jgi:monofunctional biosynthetic peptidoglycan transglycosylase
MDPARFRNVSDQGPAANEPHDPVGPATVPTTRPVPYQPTAKSEARPGAHPVAWNWRSILQRSLRYAIYAVAAYAVVVVLLVVVYRFVNPPFTTLTAASTLAGEEIEQTWVPIQRMSPYLLRAVVTSEDGRFCQHWGVDVSALKAAFDDWLNGAPRGGSTITMQVVKNLFLWPQRSLVRKAVELPLALGLELVWPKRRILEVYLNIAEWGPGIFGAEASARYHFGRSVSQLSAREAALLAVSLPNPIARDAGHPSATTQLLAARNLARLRAANVRCLGSIGRRG